MTDQHRLDLIDWHRECIILLGSGIDKMPDEPKDKKQNRDSS